MIHLSNTITLRDDITDNLELLGFNKELNTNIFNIESLFTYQYTVYRENEYKICITLSLGDRLLIEMESIPQETGMEGYDKQIFFKGTVDSLESLNTILNAVGVSYILNLK